MSQAIMSDIADERAWQDKKWGRQDHSFERWLAILIEEIGEASQAYLYQKEAKERGDVLNLAYLGLREELVQAAAVAVAMIECGDRNGWWKQT